MTERDQDTEERILAAAHAVFLRSGTAGARMQEIADEAGVNKALLHYYFRSKERLGQAVFERTAVTMFSFLFELIASPASLVEKVRTVVAAQIEFLREHPYLPGYIVSELHHHPERITRIVGTVGTPPLDRLEAQLEEAARRGEAGRERAVESFSWTTIAERTVDVYHAVLEAALAPLASCIVAAAEGPGTPLDRASAVVRAYFDLLADTPDLPFLLVQEMMARREAPLQVTSRLRQVSGALAGLVREGQEEGSIRDGDALLYALSIIAQPVHLSIVSKVLAQVAGVDPRDPGVRERLHVHTAAFVRAGLSGGEA